MRKTKDREKNMAELDSCVWFCVRECQIHSVIYCTYSNLDVEYSTTWKKDLTKTPWVTDWRETLNIWGTSIEREVVAIRSINDNWLECNTSPVAKELTNDKNYLCLQLLYVDLLLLGRVHINKIKSKNKKSEINDEWGRNETECYFCRLKRFRKTFTRYDKVRYNFHFYNSARYDFRGSFNVNIP